MAHDVRSTGVCAIRQRFHKRQHLCRGFARADLCNNRAADNSAIGDGGDGLSTFRGLDAKADDDRQIGGGLNAGNFGANIGGFCLGGTGDAGDSSANRSAAGWR